MINGIALKKYKVIEGHGDSPTFSAVIVINGKEAGRVFNSGMCGENEYRFNSEQAETVFNEAVKAWVQEVKKTGEAWCGTFDHEALFVAALIADISMQKHKARFLKAGFPVTVLCKKGKSYPYKNDAAHDDDDRGICAYH